jgi:alpha-glucuronidase
LFLEKDERTMLIRRCVFLAVIFVVSAVLYVGCQAADGSFPEAASTIPAEDGYRLWLRYASPGRLADQYRERIRQIVVQGDSETAQVISRELESAIASMLDSSLSVVKEWARRSAVIVGTPSTSKLIRNLDWEFDLASAGPEGYVIRSTRIEDQPVIAIASEGEIGALYGTFHFLRLLQTGRSIQNLSIVEHPRVQLRLLNHWDNLDGSVERGYAGRSLWQWDELPDKLSVRYTDYARANASVGINGTVINNVNADARILTGDYLRKVAALANLWRPYGIRVYLSANFAAPVRLGGLETADPLDPAVANWWKKKADEIYGLIPDFGGFLVKANSEGQPGPKDYGRTHAEGANVLADALAPHGGTVIWRAFVYDADVDPDRAKRAYIEFTKLDGQFRPNAVVQVKNGPVDFQPREPFHPLFGGMKKTPVLAELQATQEYLGQAKHLVYHGTMWKEFLDSDTFAKGAGSTVGRVLDGTVYPYRITGIVSVTNPGLDTNWCGHHFSQANWYAFGRLAWNHQLSAEQIAEEWVRMTFTNDDSTVDTIRDMMMSSWETYVSYTMPLGLHHLIGGNHYAPMPENARAPRADWTAVYYHRAAADGIGIDRTMHGDKAVGQYFPPVRDLFDSLATCPDKFLLWFHRCAWDYRMKSGRTLWEELCGKYYRGAEQARDLQTAWQSLADKIDPQRYREVADRLEIQVADATKWRDHILGYFQQYSKMPISKKTTL